MVKIEYTRLRKELPGRSLYAKRPSKSKQVRATAFAETVNNNKMYITLKDDTLIGELQMELGVFPNKKASRRLR